MFTIYHIFINGIYFSSCSKYYYAVAACYKIREQNPGKSVSIECA